MSIDNDILQEFLVEAGELYEKLDEQLVELEQTPQDTDLLNGIFRAFHTIKGGAGFMNIIPMVEICHRAEDVINLLRQGERNADAVVIDNILRVIDDLGVMFDRVNAGEEPPVADPDLLRQLDLICEGSQEEVEAVTAEPEPVVTEIAKAEAPKVEESKDAMDAEFEAILGQTQEASVGSVVPETSSDLITDDEFENLLDQIHGEGKHSNTVDEAKKESDAVISSSDLITEDEFDAMMDALHGKNKGPASKPEESIAAVAAEVPVIKPVAAAVTEVAEPEKSQPASTKKSKSSMPAAETSVRVDTSRLDDIMNLVGELVLVRNRLSTLKADMKEGQVVDAISNLELVTSDLQTSVMKTRMQPIKKVFNRFPRVIRDLARQLKKDVDLKLIGEETDLDKSLVESLADPLIHLVRNAVDHGIETPEDRFAVGKSRQGQVILKAQQEGDQILLSVSDDGKGMDHRVLREKAVEKGMMNKESANRLTDMEVYNLIFEPGFSTKTEISDVSGRGVGMDVVKTRIAELNGSIEIDSTLGSGSVIIIRLPLTLAILPTLMVRLGGYQFALPLTNVHESFNMELNEISMVDGQKVIMVREKPLPVFYLHKWMVNDSVYDPTQIDQKVIVAQMGNQRFCFVVDHIIGQEEVVIKPLGAMLSATAGFSGATITGDGGIALIIDLPSMMDRYANSY